MKKIVGFSSMFKIKGDVIQLCVNLGVDGCLLENILLKHEKYQRVSLGGLKIEAEIRVTEKHK